MKNKKIHIQKQQLPKEKGVGLIEVLIAMLVFGTALVTLSGLQNRSLQFNQSAYLRSQASMLAYDIIDRIRINRIQSNLYDRDFDDEKPADTETDLLDQDVRSWVSAIEASLPNGKGKIACESYSCTVEIRWTELAETAEDDNQTMEAFVYSSQI